MTFVESCRMLSLTGARHITTTYGNRNVREQGAIVGMGRVEDIVFEISGNAHLSCYEDLCRAVEIACAHFPEQLSMKELSAAVVPRLKVKKTTPSVSRALSRAAEDAWENGGRTILEEKYGFRIKPSPKELIFKLARAMGKSEEYMEKQIEHVGEPVKYRVWEGKCPRRYGIIASRRDEDHWMAVAPFLRDEDTATAIVHVLNEMHMPMEVFRELAFSNTLTDLIVRKSNDK